MQNGRADSNLPLVRRLEAVGFRAWPAATVQYDGSWQVRLTGGHSSKRLNCVVALDPSDHRDIGLRLEKARRKFESYGRPLLVRETPLAPAPMVDFLKAEGWERFEEVITMTAPLSVPEPAGILDHLPSHDIGRFVDAVLAVSPKEGSKAGLAEIVTAIKPPTGFFTKETPDQPPTGVLLCVHDNDLAGIMSLAVAAEQRGLGIGYELVASALRWARMRGAQTGWLQVGADNQPALALYRKFGFTEAYRYHYWREGQGQ